MKTFEDIQTELLDLRSEILNDTIAVSPEELHLDRRSAHLLYCGQDFIAVSKSQDSTLKYYGGFKYIDKEYCLEVGDIVVYSAFDSRVADHLDNLER